MNGPPAGSLVVWGWGRPATVEPGLIAVVGMLTGRLLQEDGHDVGGFMGGAARRGGGPGLARPQLEGALAHIPEHDGDQHEFHDAARRHASLRVLTVGRPP